jgi:hypothetical protein
MILERNCARFGALAGAGRAAFDTEPERRGRAAEVGRRRIKGSFD